MMKPNASLRSLSESEGEKQSIWTPFLLILTLVTLMITLATGSIVLGVLAAIGQFLVLTVIVAFRAYTQKRLTRRKWVAILVVELIVVAALFQFLKYEPGLIAAPGYALHNITEPGWLSGPFKTIHTAIEQTPCTYTLLGWQEDETLVYKADCARTSQIWRYEIAADKSEEISTAPLDLFTNAVPSTSIIEGVLANVYPRELATVSREVFIVDDAFPSPNGRFTALISRHIYGPQDILLLTPPVSK